ncbi:MAG: thermonuclease family protein [Hyphomicrobiaceae bacterium]|nr:thermonuclease family protein [Hyphomicrobiaceae bacterium]
MVWGAAPPGPEGRPVAGNARVIDGDTLEIDGTRVRLEGIDAPETGQRCARKLEQIATARRRVSREDARTIKRIERASDSEGSESALVGSWACGAAATTALVRLTESKRIECRPRGTDKYGRLLGVCFADGRDINAAMVRQGLAWAFVRYSTAYVSEEKAARGERLGIWQADTETAWDYRAKRWTAVEDKAPSGCAIKGNVTRNGRIYHMPWSPWYGRIQMDLDKGKRWFCTEAEALAAGWRPVEAH